MPLQQTNPTATNAWKQLEQLCKKEATLHCKELFATDPSRAKRLSREWGDFFVDFSKNRITEESVNLLLQLAEEMSLDDAIKKFFEGDVINQTEGRAVLHTALRAKKDEVIWQDGVNVVDEVHQVRNKIKEFCVGIISGSTKGYTGKAFTDVVNIGIGGSDLGPFMVTEALAFYKNHLTLHYVSNIDGDHVHEALKQLDPETTLFIIVSKSFTTQETLGNATTSKNWFLQTAGQEDVPKHFIAVSSNVEKAVAYGIKPDNIFPMWDWVGGRFSLWSAVGLSAALGIGYENFEKLLDGANAMDRHFKETELENNLPVLMALLTVWYNNFLGAETEAIIPYTQYLHRFSAYLQQGFMESNGKRVDRAGLPVTYQTGTVIWGEPGTNAQHAFFQLIHQGTKLIPADFIGFRTSLHGDQEHHDKLMANFFAQTEALMNGKTKEEAASELELSNNTAETIEALLPFKIFPGNNPTTTILIEKLTPHSLGALIAMYEHKIFVQGVLWNIFSFDQWGVELGKQLATTILAEIQTKNTGSHDSSTSQLIHKFLNK
ncbi:MAG: glucose-6-phosphate isomerase [Flavobacteriaceae bacterium]|nr:glucose-6-phosphate isomerase [Flavobacteriaceae bacterium]